MKGFLYKYILPHLIWSIYRALIATWRIQIVNSPEFKKVKEKGPSLMAHWHGDELALVHVILKLPVSTMTSTSRDGQLIDHVIRKFGGTTSKGSSTRGGASALRGLIRLCRQGWNASVAVDGPKGPLHQVKPGIFELSRLTQLPIVPVGVNVQKAWIFKKSWNKARLPKPFSRVVVVFGPPMAPISRDQDPKCPDLCLQLKDQINAARLSASKYIAAS